MKLHILSDLHQSRGALELPRNDADVVILAGDISRPKDAVAWALGFNKPVLYVPGNHEFYGSSLSATVAELKHLCAGTCVQVLDNDVVVINGVRFLGSTLWTDFMDPHGVERAQVMQEAQQFMRDFSAIRIDGPESELLTPEFSAVLCRENVTWLENQLAQTYAGPTVVITHHAPSLQSIHPRFAGSPLNACFVSDLQHLMEGRRAVLWVHGHTHDSFDYTVNGTRVVCNPRGYAKDGLNENPLFNSHFVVQLEPSARPNALV